MPDFGVMQIPLALIAIVIAVWAIFRGTDVRLALMISALTLGGLSGSFSPVVREFLATFSNEKFVIPICTAMGFAYVLRHTECDHHLVLLLTNPLRHARWFIIPGVILVGFLVNIPVISQTSTAVCIGTVVVPLMRAAKISNSTIGATLLLGASIGGELLNPGAPELNTVGQRLGIPTKEIVPKIIPLLMPHLVIATIAFWIFSVRYERKNINVATRESQTVRLEKVSFIKALVPLVPLALLFATGPPLNLTRIPENWVVQRPMENIALVAGSPAVMFEKKDPYYETRLIGFAMLFGVLVAAIANRDKVKGMAKSFFDGAGYAFTEIISLIVIANCFGKAIEQVGLANLIGQVIREVPGMLIPSAGLIPLSFATISGSGMASTQSLYGFFVEPSRTLEVDPVSVGAVVSVGSAAGRTMSPVAAVALMAARMTGTNSFELARRVAIPLILGMLGVILLGIWRI